MDILTYGLLNKKIEEAKNVSGEKITDAVNTYLNENPVTPGATAEQAAQIAENKNGISELKGDLAALQTAAERKYAVKTVMDSVATPHTQYFLGVQTSVEIVLPDTADVGQIISVGWYNGDTAATLSITGTMLDFDFTPSENSRSEINALWDGTYWAVLGNEMAVVL
ncbi:MAG: hypothetical protein ACI4DS_00830 [Eubacterium sp.]